MKRMRLLAWGVALLFLTVAGAAEGRLSVLCSLFPVYDFARQTAGDRAEVRLLLPPGAEAHSFEPRPQDMRALNDAGLFIYTGPVMEPWAERIAGTLRTPVLEAGAGIPLVGRDPHVWLDLSLARRMLGNIAEGLCRVDPEGTELYRRNAADYDAELAALDREFQALVDGAARRTLVFGGHFAFGYFLRRYGLDFVSAYEGEAEPSARRVAEVIRYIRENGVHFILHDEPVPPPVARSIAEETGASPLRFSSAHDLTREEMERGLTFLEVMRANRDAAALALR